MLWPILVLNWDDQMSRKPRFLQFGIPVHIENKSSKRALNPFSAVLLVQKNINVASLNYSPIPRSHFYQVLGYQFLE